MKTTLSNTGVVIWGSGTDTVSRADFNTAFQNLEDRVPVVLTGTRPGASSARRFHYDAGTNRFSYDTGSKWVDVGSSTTEVSVVSSETTKITALYAGIANQTANILEARDSGGVNLFSVGPTGVVATKDVTLSGSIAGLFANVSNAARKVQVVRGALNQTASLTEWQTNAGAVLASISSAGQIAGASLDIGGGVEVGGNIIANGNVTGKRFSVSESSTDFLFVGKNTNGSNTKDLLSVFGLAADAGMRVAATGQLVVPSAIVGQDLAGTTPPSRLAAFYVKNNVVAEETLHLQQATSQTAPAINVVQGSTSLFSVSSAGNLFASGAIKSNSSGTFPGGVYNTTTPLAIGGRTPAAEFIMGSATGAFTDDFVLRHSATSATAAARILRTTFKLGTEAAGDTDKSASIGVMSSSASSANPMLTGWQGGAQVFQFATDKRLVLAGNLDVDKELKFLNSDAQNISITPDKKFGIGAFGSTNYVRYDTNFQIVRGGSHVPGGSGGTTMLTLDSTGALNNKGRITGTEIMLADSKTVLSNGSLITYEYTGKQGFGTMYLNYDPAGAGGFHAGLPTGTIMLNNGNGVTVMNGINRVTHFEINGNRLWIGGIAPTNPEVGDVWIQV